MKASECTKCKSNELYEDNGYLVCAYCRVKFVRSSGERPDIVSAIAIIDDVERLLSKCINDPLNKRRYANLILDIDPHNAVAKSYL